MKKWRKVVRITLVGILAMALFINTKSFAKTVVITTDGLNLREKASKTSDVLEIISQDEEVQLIEEIDEWYKVKYNGITGYISKEYSKIKDENSTPNNTNQNNNTNNNDNKTNNVPNSQPEETTTTTTTPIEASSQMKLSENTKGYILPLINSNVIHEFNKDEIVVTVSVVNGWTYVESNTANAWVRTDKLINTNTQISKDNTTVPTSTEPKTEQPTNNEGSTDGGDKNVSEGNNQEGNDDNSDNTKNEGETTSKTQNNDSGIKVTPMERTIMYVQEPSVYVRSGPATTYDVVDSLIINNSVIVTGKADDWYQVQVDGKDGYVASWLLGNSQKEITSRGDAQRNPQNSAPTETSTTTSNSTESSSVGQQIVSYAKNYLGCKYVYGGSGPNTFDCSGFTMYVYKKFGFSLSHSATAQSQRGTYVSKENLQPGDLVFFKDYQTMDGIGHCGIYIGGGEFIHASSGTGYCVKVSTLLSGSYEKRYATARRIL